MPNLRDGCFGVSYNSKFYVLKRPYDQNTMKFSPLDRQWRSRKEIWLKPFKVGRQRIILGIDDHLYAVKDEDRKKSVEALNIQTGDWLHLGSVPPVTFPDNPKWSEYFDYCVCGLRNKLYIMGVIHLGTGKLKTVRVCDLSVTPLQWRKTRLINSKTMIVSWHAHLLKSD
ncbi:hypothetical protein QQ045_014800 [Rhodiola kirilowii]